MGTFLVGICVLLIILFIIKGMIKNKKAGKSMICGGDCKHCGGRCSHK